METYTPNLALQWRAREKQQNNKHAINEQLLLLFHMGKCANIPYGITLWCIVGIISTANVHRNCNITIYLLYNYGKLDGCVAGMVRSILASAATECWNIYGWHTTILTIYYINILTDSK